MCGDVGVPSGRQYGGGGVVEESGEVWVYLRVEGKCFVQLKGFWGVN